MALRPVSGAVSNQTTIAPEENDAENSVPRRGKTEQAVVTGLRDEYTGGELAHRAVDDGDPIVAEVDHSDIGYLGVVVAMGTRAALAVDRVPVQVQGDVVGADDDPVVGAVGEVLVEDDVGGDRVAAVQLLRGLRTLLGP
jgi:hypothetical protein